MDDANLVVRSFVGRSTAVYRTAVIIIISFIISMISL